MATAIAALSASVCTPGEKVMSILMMARALSGDIKWVVSPATTTRAATTAAWTRTVDISLQDADGNVHEWADFNLAEGVAIADNSSGTATIPSTTLQVRNGRASVVVSGNQATWAEADTNTLTVSQFSFCGHTIAAKTSVETITA